MMIRFSLLLGGLVASSALAAETTAMFVTKAINLDPAQVAALGTVCATQYGQVSGGPVIAPLEAQVAVGENGSLRDATQTLSAREYVELTVVHLGTSSAIGRVIIDAVRRSADGSELFRSNLTADSLDDALPACERLALALTRKVPVAETMTRHNVTAAEARASRRPNRVGSERVFGVKASFGQPFASRELNPLATLAFNARLEGERYFIELGVGALIPAATTVSGGSYGGIDLELGASYYLTDADIAPYVGVGVRPRVVFSSTFFGLAPYAQVGLMLFRQSSTRLYVDARVSQNVLAVSTPATFNSAAVYPTELALEIGVGF